MWHKDIKSKKTQSNCIKILLRFPSTWRSTRPSSCLGLAICSRKDLRSVGMMHDAYSTQYVIGQLSSRTCHHVLSVAALDKSLSMVLWRWHVSVSKLCCWCMAVSFWVASMYGLITKALVLFDDVGISPYVGGSARSPYFSPIISPTVKLGIWVCLVMSMSFDLRNVFATMLGSPWNNLYVRISEFGSFVFLF